jgi:hypothetical protein
MQDAADHPPIVDPRFTRLTVRQMWLDPRPGLIRKPEQLCHRDPPALETSNLRRKRKRQQLVLCVPYLALKTIPIELLLPWYLLYFHIPGMNE